MEDDVPAQLPQVSDLAAQVVSQPAAAAQGRPGADWKALPPQLYDAARVQELVAAGADINAANAEGGTALMLAAMHGHAASVSALVAAGADVSAVDAQGRTALMRAAFNGQTACLPTLLAAGADANAADAAGQAALLQAAWAGHSTCVSLLLAAGADVNAADAKGCVALHAAANRGNIACVSLLLAADVDVNAADDRRNRALSLAASGGHAACVDALLAAGADANAADIDGVAPLLVAAYRGHSTCVSSLLAAGADVNAADAQGYTALHAAASHGDNTCVSLLLAAGADVNAAQARGYRALALAAPDGHAACVDELLAACVDDTAAGAAGWTPLLMAAYNGHSTCVSSLLAAGANVNAAEAKGCQALHLAAMQGHAEVLPLLLAAGAQVDAADAKGRYTELMQGAFNAHVKFVAEFLSLGANFSLKGDEPGRSAHMLAAMHGHAACVTALVAAGADVNAADASGTTVLHWAARSKSATVVSALLAAGADVNAADNNGGRALHDAALAGNAASVSMLLEAGAEIEAVQDVLGYTATMQAASKGHAGCVAALLAAGADVHATDSMMKCTALMLAAQGDHDAVMHALLAAGADANAADKYGRTPMDEALNRGHAAGVSVLAAAGVDVNAADEYGHTLLRRAAYRGFAGCVSALVAAGADINAADEFGHTALQDAVSSGHPDCVTVLAAAGADVNATNKRGRPLLIRAASCGHAACVSALINAGADLQQSIAIAQRDRTFWAAQPDTLSGVLLAQPRYRMHLLAIGVSPSRPINGISWRDLAAAVVEDASSPNTLPAFSTRPAPAGAQQPTRRSIRLLQQPERKRGTGSNAQAAETVLCTSGVMHALLQHLDRATIGIMRCSSKSMLKAVTNGLSSATLQLHSLADVQQLLDSGLLARLRCVHHIVCEPADVCKAAALVMDGGVEKLLAACSSSGQGIQTMSLSLVAAPGTHPPWFWPLLPVASSLAQCCSAHLREFKAFAAPGSGLRLCASTVAALKQCANLRRLVLYELRPSDLPLLAELEQLIHLELRAANESRKSETALQEDYRWLPRSLQVLDLDGFTATAALLDAASRLPCLAELALRWSEFGAPQEADASAISVGGSQDASDQENEEGGQEQGPHAAEAGDQQEQEQEQSPGQDEWHQQHACRFPQLTRLVLHNPGRLLRGSAAQLPQLLGSMQFLRSLTIRLQPDLIDEEDIDSEEGEALEADEIRDEAAMLAVAAATSLQRLSVYEAVSSSSGQLLLTDAVLAHWAANLRSLETLTLRCWHNWAVTDKGLQALATGVTQLSSVCLEGIDLVTAAGARALAASPSLRRLQLDACCPVATAVAAREREAAAAPGAAAASDNGGGSGSGSAAGAGSATDLRDLCPCFSCSERRSSRLVGADAGTVKIISRPDRRGAWGW